MPKRRKPPLATFSHRRLSSPDSIRLLALLPSTRFDAPIETTILEVDLDDYAGNGSIADYEALSYVWGSPVGTEPVRCEGKVILLTPNCHDALRHLRLAAKRRILWIDAICIDQGRAKESVKERGLQVSLMGDIYAKAKRTICWIGEGNKCTRELLRLLEQIGSCPTQRGLKKFLLLDERLRRECELDADDSSLDHVLSHPWHSRIWTVQEVVYSRNCSIMCGHTSISWDDYSRAVKFLVFENFIEQVGMQAHRSLVAIDLRNVLREYILERPSSLPSSNSQDEEDEFDRRIVFLSSCLSDLNQLQATNAKDKIYGLQALYLGLGIPMPHVDYGKSLAKVYEGAAVAMISWSGKLRVLGDACRTNHNASFPSWVPDWSDRSLNISTPTGNASASSRVSNANPTALNPVSGELHLHGKIIGTLEAWTDHHAITAAFPSHPGQCAELCFSEAASDLVEDTEFLRLWIQKVVFFRQLYTVLETNDAYCNGFDLEDILCDLLNQDSYSEPDNTFRDWLDILQFPNTTYDLTYGENLVTTWEPRVVAQTSAWSDETRKCAVIVASLIANRILLGGREFDGGPDLLDIMGRFSTNLTDKSLMLTKQGSGNFSLGTSTISVAPRDVVVLLEGAEWPVILRQQGLTWRFIGPAFIIGMMDEGVWSKEQCDMEDWRSFVLG